MPQHIEVRAVRNGGLDYVTVPTALESTIEALERERVGYVQRGLTDRVAAVDTELRRLRGQPDPDDDPDDPRQPPAIDLTKPGPTPRRRRNRGRW